MKCLKLTGVLVFALFQYALFGCTESEPLVTYYSPTNISDGSEFKKLLYPFLAENSVDQIFQIETVWLKEWGGIVSEDVDATEVRDSLQRAKQSIAEGDSLDTQHALVLAHVLLLARQVGAESDEQRDFLGALKRRFTIQSKDVLARESTVPRAEYSLWKAMLVEGGVFEPASDTPCADINVPEEPPENGIVFPSLETRFQGEVIERAAIAVRLEFNHEIPQIHAMNLEAAWTSAGQQVAQGNLCAGAYRIALCMRELGHTKYAYWGSTPNGFIHQKFLEQGWTNTAAEQPYYREQHVYYQLDSSRFECINGLSQLRKGQFPQTLYLVNDEAPLRSGVYSLPVN